MSINLTEHAKHASQDCLGHPVVVGDTIRILGITPDPTLDEDDLDMFLDMIGSQCEIERIDPDGTAWVAVWWNGGEGTLMTLAGLAPSQMQKIQA
ncbi:MAG: hypothetical protein L6Q40_03785 [Azonexus sp.]|nr:hypothetical protein [Azonexus sp.]